MQCAASPVCVLLGEVGGEAESQGQQHVEQGAREARGQRSGGVAALQVAHRTHKVTQ